MDVLTLKLHNRNLTGKRVNVLRKQGLVPVHLYGADTPSLALQADGQNLRRLLDRAGTNIPLSVEVEGRSGENICFVREIQRHPVSEELLHVDFMRVDVSRVIRAEVPILIRGTSPAVQLMGGTLLLQLQTLTVESLPMNVPSSFDVDVSGLVDFETGIYVREIPASVGVVVINDPDMLITRVSAPRIEVEAVGGQSGEAAEDGVETVTPEGLENQG